MVKCAVKTCKNKKSINPGMHLHRLPVGDPFRVKRWLIALKMDPNMPKFKFRQLYVCNKHFRPEDYLVLTKTRVQRHLLKDTAVPSLFIQTPTGPNEAVSVVEEELAPESPAATEGLECEEDNMEPMQESLEKSRQGKRGEEEPGTSAEDPDGEMEVDGETNVLQVQRPDSPIVKIIPIPTDVLPDPTSSPPGHNGTLNSPETSPQVPELAGSPGGPLGFLLNGRPVNLQPGGRGAELQLLSQPGGSAGGFSTLQIPLTLTIRSPTGVKTINTVATGTVSFSPPTSSACSSPTPVPTPIITGVVSGSSAEEVASLGQAGLFHKPSMVITGVLSGSAAEQAVREHSLNFTPGAPDVVPSPPLPTLMPQALMHSLAQAKSLPVHPVSPGRTGGHQPAVDGTSPSTRKILHRGMTGPVKPPDCPVCCSQFKVIKALRGFMCLCSPLIARSLDHYYHKTKSKHKDSSKSSRSKSKKHRRSSKGSKSKDKVLSHVVPTGTGVSTPSLSHQDAASPVRTWSGPPPENQMNKLIILVEDFYYGTHKPSPPSGGPLPEKPGGPYRCIHCHQLLANNIELMAHTKQHAEVISQEDGEMKRHISCQHCYRSFKSPFRLQCHLEAVHSRYESNTKCKICEWAYENEPAFLMHMKKKHKPGEMPYVCQVCDYQSSFYSSVFAHFTEAHADTSCLLCPYCLKVHRNGSFYQQHCTRHLKKNVFNCSKCRLHFLCAKERTDHKALHHRTHIRPPQLEGLAPGTKVTVRTYSVVGGPVREGSTGNQIPVTKAMDVPPDTPPAEAPRKKPVESLGTLLFHVGEDGSVSDRARCVECLFKIPDISCHFPTLVHCSHCKYLTCCSRAYANHMINDHSSRKSSFKYQTIYQSYPREAVRLKCMLCRFSTITGDKMANHLSDHPDHWARTSLSWMDQDSDEEENSPDKSKHRHRDMAPRRVTSVEVLEMRNGVLETVRDRPGGAFIPIHLLPEGTPSTQLSVRPLTKPPPLCSTTAMTVRFLSTRLGSDEDADVNPLRPLPAPLTIKQLRVVLYALCNGLPQAAQKYHTAPLLIRAWTLQQEQRRATRVWSWKSDCIAEWVLAQREQQLPVTEQNLLETVTQKLNNMYFGDKNGYKWAVDFMLHHNLSLHSTVRAKKTVLPRAIFIKTRTFTRFLRRQVKNGGFKPCNIGVLDELSVFMDPADLTAQDPLAFQLCGPSESALFDIVLSGRSDGTFFTPMLLFRGEMPTLPGGFPDNVHLEACPQGFTDQQRLSLWLDKIWCQQVDPQNEGDRLLILDTHRGHLEEEFLAALGSAHTSPSIIPTGCSCRLQPLDICITPVIREFLQARWSQLVSSGGSEGLELGQLALTLACWLSEVASTLKQMPEILRRSFTMVCTLPQNEGEEGCGWMVKFLTEALIGQPEAEEQPKEPMEVEEEEEEGEEEEEKGGSEAEDQPVEEEEKKGGSEAEEQLVEVEEEEKKGGSEAEGQLVEVEVEEKKGSSQAEGQLVEVEEKKGGSEAEEQLVEVEEEKGGSEAEEQLVEVDEKKGGSEAEEQLVEVEEKKGGSEAEEQLVEEEEKKGGSEAEGQRGLQALRQVFEKDSDLESFYGFEQMETH